MFRSDVAIFAYALERMLNWRILLLWLFLMLCTLMASPVPPSLFVWLAAVTALFIFVFRLWDDIEDVEYDREQFPERAVVARSSLQSFRITLLLLMLLLTGAVSLFQPAKSVIGFLVMLAVFALTYRLTSNRIRWRPYRVALVLMKYPALVLILSNNLGELRSLGWAICALIPPLVDELVSVGASIIFPALCYVGILVVLWAAYVT